jgi:hypothetical protein
VAEVGDRVAACSKGKGKVRPHGRAGQSGRGGGGGEGVAYRVVDSDRLLKIAKIAGSR